MQNDDNEYRDKIALRYLEKTIGEGYHNIFGPDDDLEDIKSNAEQIADLVWIYTNEFMRSRSAKYSPNTDTLLKHDDTTETTGFLHDKP